jgi:hypothetical protein
MNTARRLPEQALHHGSHSCDSNEEFASIEAAVAGTARGRWFLDEYVRRAQDRDNERIIAALTRIERMLNVDAQVREQHTREQLARQQAAPPARPSPPTFASPPVVPASSSAPVGSSPPARPGAALPVLSALRASGGLAAPTPAPRAAPRAAAPIAPSPPAPARSLTDTLEQALRSMPTQGGGAAKAEARKPEVHLPEVHMPEIHKLASAAPAPPVRQPPPAVPPAPAFTPRPASAARPSQPTLVINAKAFAHLEAMDAAARAKMFA